MNQPTAPTDAPRASPDAAARAAARADWPIHRYALGEEPADDLAGTTAAERIAMVWPVTLSAWRLAGLTVPDCPRAQMPGRLRRLGEPP